MTNGDETSIRGLLDSGIRPDEPGAVVGVYRDGKLQEAVAAGRASLEYDQPITAHTIFNIGSCSKQFTGAAAVLLHEEGRLDLDAPIREHLPELPVGHAVSVRQCLHHTAGLNDYLSVDDIAGLPIAATADETDALRYLARQRSTQFPPGTSIAYSNTNFVAAALALQRAAGQPFAQLVHERIFAPLNMRDSRIRDRIGLVVPNMAFSYESGPDGYLRQEMPEALPGDSNVLTNITDLARWSGFLIDGRTLGESTRTQLTTPARLLDGTATSYALGLFTGRIGEATCIGHSGSHYGYRAFVLCLPDRDFTIAILANRSDLDMRDLVAHLLARHTPAPGPVGDAPTSATVATVAGCWYAADVNEMLQVRAEDKKLVVTDIGAPRPLVPSGSGRWASWDGLPTLHVAGSELIWTNRMGRRTRYRRLDRQEPVAAPLAGSYFAAEFGLRVEVAGGADRLCYRPGDRPPIALEYAGRVGERCVYYAGWHVLAFTVRADKVVSLTVRCENASVAGFVPDQVEEPAP